MNEFKGTPGPWHWYEPQGAATNPSNAAFVIGPKRITMDRSVGFSVEDAKLIAAAPDLLAALQEIYRHGIQAFGEDFEVMLEAKAAIDKATSISN